MLTYRTIVFSLAACFSAVVGRADTRELRLENPFLSRTVVLDAGRLATTKLSNKVAKQELVPTGGGEFRLRLSQDVDSPEPDVLLTAADFEITKSAGTAQAIRVDLRNANHGLRVTLLYTLKPNETYGHKQIEITSDR